MLISGRCCATIAYKIPAGLIGGSHRRTEQWGDGLCRYTKSKFRVGTGASHAQAGARTFRTELRKPGNIIGKASKSKPST